MHDPQKKFVAAEAACDASTSDAEIEEMLERMADRYEMEVSSNPPVNLPF